MSLTITMKADSRLELGVGTVIDERKEWMYNEYFPAVGPVMMEYGQQTLGSFAVLASNTEKVSPVQGSLTSWPSAEVRVQFHKDPRFAKVHQMRDDALSVFSDSHLFHPLNNEIDLSTDNDYAIVIAEENQLNPNPIFKTALADDSPARRYSGKSISLYPWDKDTERLLEGSPEQAAVFRIRFNPKAS